MATLATQTITRAGVAAAYTAAAGGGDKLTPDQYTFLHVKNGGGSSITVTIVTPRDALPNVAVADVAVSVPNGGERMIGPFPAEHFAGLTDGLADITYSGVTSVTVGAFRVSQP